MTTSIINTETLKTLREMTALPLQDCRKALSETDNDLNQAIDLLKTWGTLKAQHLATTTSVNGAVLASVDHDLNTGAIVEINCRSNAASTMTAFKSFCEDFIDYLIGFKGGDMSEVKAIEDKKHAFIAITNEIITTPRNRVFDYLGAEETRLVAYNHPGSKLAVLLSLEVKGAKRDHAAIIQLGDDIAMQIAAMHPMATTSADLRTDIVEKQRGIFRAHLANEPKPDNIKEKMLEGRMNKFFGEVCLLQQVFVKDSKKTITDLIASVEGETGAKIKVLSFVRYELGGKDGV
jgi:elongation factor Ts